MASIWDQTESAIEGEPIDLASLSSEDMSQSTFNVTDRVVLALDSSEAKMLASVSVSRKLGSNYEEIGKSPISMG